MLFKSDFTSDAISDIFFYILVTTENEMNKFKQHFKNNFLVKRLEIMATVWRDFSGVH